MVTLVFLLYLTALWNVTEESSLCESLIIFLAPSCLLCGLWMIRIELFPRNGAAIISWLKNEVEKTSGDKVGVIDDTW